ncbi:MAG: glycosyltransferase family 2 protein [Alphaproteobacteria bacterium]|nr:glycosyltransferase family 2 protein [Alphaproteobacteria bacterium]
MTVPGLSALVVAHNEERQLADCLATLAFADQVVVVLDRCSDRSAEIARHHGADLIEGAWPIEGDRRNAGIAGCRGPWIFEVDADERVPAELAAEIRHTIAAAAPGHFLVPFDNYVGERLVRYGWGGSWGVSSAPRLFTKGAKRWGRQRIHPRLELQGEPRRLQGRMIHYVDANISDMLRRLDRYTSARAADLRESGDIGTLPANLRRVVSRFIKCYVGRKGYREGAWGLLISLLAALYPLLSHLKARLERG